MKILDVKKQKPKQKNIEPEVNYDEIVSKFKKGSLAKDYLYRLLSKVDSSHAPSTHIEILIASGLPIVKKNQRYILETKTTLYKEQIFCIVDIETNGSKAPKDQIIEIGAVKYQNGKIIDNFKSLVYTKSIPVHVSKVTNITIEDLKDAPKNRDVLKAFKLFLADSVFVAHNVKFDYNFISAWLEKIGYGKLVNRHLCSIDLAKRTINSSKFGLQHLKEYLNIDEHIMHRAYEDALATAKVFEYSLNQLPQNIKTTEDLIDFSKSDNIIAKTN